MEEENQEHPITYALVAADARVAIESRIWRFNQGFSGLKLIPRSPIPRDTGSGYSVGEPNHTS